MAGSGCTKRVLGAGGCLRCAQRARGFVARGRREFAGRAIGSAAAVTWSVEAGWDGVDWGMLRVRISLASGVRRVDLGRLSASTGVACARRSASERLDTCTFAL